MSDEHIHHPDGLEQQRQALETMSSDLTLKLQAMISEQNQRAHEFNAVVADYEEPEPEPELITVSYAPEPTYAPAPEPAQNHYPTPPPAPWAQPTPKPARKAPKPALKPAQKRRTVKPSPKEEGSISGVTITCIVIAVYLFIQCCS